MPSETTTACAILLVFLRIRRGTFPYGVEDDASTMSQTPTTHYTNTCVKLTTVTHLFFSERIAIANLSFKIILRGIISEADIEAGSTARSGRIELMRLRTRVLQRFGFCLRSPDIDTMASSAPGPGNRLLSLRIRVRKFRGNVPRATTRAFGFLYSFYRIPQPSSAASSRATRTRGHLIPPVMGWRVPRTRVPQEQSLTAPHPPRAQ